MNNLTLLNKYIFVGGFQKYDWYPIASIGLTFAILKL